ncbi:hypothetical protein IC762_27375 [Bradyrhizobium genosp. L]|uniref:hypothetical protein n=1 Tax=Bradyrhizobium genosp. L TaxID=83637 RepID=UPI0018A2EAAD|nr:hypothetical protein [Bradyrhizobium genosp. L]QPF83402.1 hypothetical protein IC762_27375 [Bradyrhizobium genosp. L]
MARGQCRQDRMSMLQNFGVARSARLPASGNPSPRTMKAGLDDDLKQRLSRLLRICIGLMRRWDWTGRLLSRDSEIGDYRRLERICRQLAAQATMPEQHTAMLIMARRYRAAARALARGHRFAIAKAL